MAPILQGGDRDTVYTDSSGAIAKFEVTNLTEDFSFDCNVNNTLVTSDVLGTLIKDLIRRGVIEGTTA